MNNPNRQSRSASGFTLLELLVASILGTFIAVVAVSSLRTIISSRGRIDEVVTVAEELRFITDRIRQDLTNLKRDTQRNEVLLYGSIETSDAGPVPVLSMRSINRSPVRSSYPEGEIQHIQYYLGPAGPGFQKESALLEEPRKILFRRAQPVVGTEPSSETNRGVLVALSEHVFLFEVLYFDGTEWQSEWPQQNTELPEIIKVTLGAQNRIDSNESEELGWSDQEEQMQLPDDAIITSFSVTFPRFPEMESQQESGQNSET